VTTQDMKDKISEAQRLLREIEEEAIIEFSSVRHQAHVKSVYRSGIYVARSCHESLGRYADSLTCATTAQV
jgi:hypothetical protein